MSYQFAEINGVRMHYAVQGQGEALVLIHAGIANLNMWDEQVTAFSAHFRTLRYDVRGWGETPDPAGDYTEHGDLAGLLDHLNIARAAVLGISNGGRIAMDFALAYPERISKLVVVAPGLGGFSYPEDKAMEALEEKHGQALKRGDIGLAAEYEARMWVDGPRRSPAQADPQVRQRALQMIRHTLQLPQGEGVGSIVQPPAAGRLAEIKVPTLVLIGDQDAQSLFAVVDSLTAEIPDVRKAVMQDVAHLPNLEKPEQFNQIVLDFLLE